MTRMIRRFIPSFAATLVAAGLILAPAAASASTRDAGAAPPSCNGQTCDGKDPAATNCVNDAKTIYSREAVAGGTSYGVLEMRYSAKCYANWVRFTPWSGVRAWVGNGLAKAEVGGSPWIWRQGVANSLRGTINRSSPVGVGITTWTSMVTAAGTTCWSVGIYQTEFSQSGGGSRDDLGTYNGPCVK